MNSHQRRIIRRKAAKISGWKRLCYAAVVEYLRQHPQTFYTTYA